MLGYGGLGQGEVIDDLPGDAARVGHEELENLEALGIGRRLEEGDETSLLLSVDIETAAGWGQGWG